MGAAVQHVEHRHRQHRRRRAAEVGVERQAGRLGRRLGHRQRDAEDGVGAETPLVVGAVELAHRAVDQRLVAGVAARQLERDLLAHVGHRLQHALAAVALAAVAQLERLAGAGGRAGRHGGTPAGAAVQHAIDLEGRIPPGIEDLPGENFFDGKHGHLLQSAILPPAAADGRPSAARLPSESPRYPLLPRRRMPLKLPFLRPRRARRRGPAPRRPPPHRRRPRAARRVGERRHPGHPGRRRRRRRHPGPRLRRRRDDLRRALPRAPADRQGRRLPGRVPPRPRARGLAAPVDAEPRVGMDDALPDRPPRRTKAPTRSSPTAPSTAGATSSCGTARCSSGRSRRPASTTSSGAATGRARGPSSPASSATRTTATCRDARTW